MQRFNILIDSNILISALVFDGICRKLLLELINRHHYIFVSQYIDHEFRNKIIEKWENKSKIFLLKYEELRIPILESSSKEIEKIRDSKDIPIINDAIAYNIDILFTGDKDFQNLKCKVKVMNIEQMIKFLY